MQFKMRIIVRGKVRIKLRGKMEKQKRLEIQIHEMRINTRIETRDINVRRRTRIKM